MNIIIVFTVFVFTVFTVQSDAEMHQIFSEWMKRKRWCLLHISVHCLRLSMNSPITAFCGPHCEPFKTRVCVDLWVYFESWSVLYKTQGLSPTLSLDRERSSPTSAWVVCSVESLCFFWSLHSHIYIYEEYFRLYNWLVFWVACIFSVCVFLVARPQATLSLTHIQSFSLSLSCSPLL